MRELSHEEYSKIKPLIIKTSYGLENHSIFKSYEAAVNCKKPISLNGSAYKGRKNKGTTHIKDIVKLPDGRFALLSKTLCNDAGIEYIPDSTPLRANTEYKSDRTDRTNKTERTNRTYKTESTPKKEPERINVPGRTEKLEIEKQNNSNSLNLQDNVIQRSQIGAASVGNVNVNINQKSSTWLLALLLVLVCAILFLLFR